MYASNQHLSHDFEAQVIAPRQSVDVNLTFYPREAIRYHEVITFEINGLSKQNVEIFGPGTAMKV